MLKIAPGQAVRRSHVAVLLPVPPAPTRHPLEMLADRAARRLDGCSCTFIAGCYAPAMLMIESTGDAGPHVADTWVITVASPTTMRLEVMVDEARFDLLAEGPPDRILTRLVALQRRPARTFNRHRVGPNLVGP